MTLAILIVAVITLVVVSACLGVLLRLLPAAREIVGHLEVQADYQRAEAEDTRQRVQEQRQLGAPAHHLVGPTEGEGTWCGTCSCGWSAVDLDGNVVLDRMEQHRQQVSPRRRRTA